MLQQSARTRQPQLPQRPTTQSLPEGQDFTKVMAKTSGLKSSEPREHERRRARRISFPGEIAVRWEFPNPNPVLVEIVDISDTGLRISTTHLVPVERRGEALHIVPERSSIGRPFVVVWSVEMLDGAFHSGVRFTDRD